MPGNRLKPTWRCTKCGMLNRYGKCWRCGRQYRFNGKKVESVVQRHNKGKV